MERKKGENLNRHFAQVIKLADIGMSLCTYNLDRHKGIPEEELANEIRKQMSHGISNSKKTALHQVNDWEQLLVSALSKYVLNYAIKRYESRSIIAMWRDDVDRQKNIRWYEAYDFDQFYLDKTLRAMENFVIGPLAGFVGKENQTKPENYIKNISSRIRMKIHEQRYLTRAGADGFVTTDSSIDRIRLNTLQQKGVISNLKPVELTEEDKELLDEFNKRHDFSIYQIAEEILEEIPKITWEEAESLLRQAGISGNNIHEGVMFIMHKQYERSLRDFKKNDPEKLKQLAAFYRKNGDKIPDIILQIISET